MVMRKFILYFIVLFCAGSIGFAQDITGSWQGNLNAGGTNLPLVFHIKQQNQGWVTVFDSPAQNAFGLATGKTIFNQDSLIITIPLINGSYTGKWNGADLIEGLFQQGDFKAPMVLKKSSTPIPPPKPTPAIIRPQTPKPPFDYSSEDLVFSNADNSVQFGATLTLPKNKTKFPTVILISGSGAQDRDGTMFNHKIYWVLADHLTKSGIGVLRIDDRGTGKTSLGPHPELLTSKDFANDVLAAIQFLLTRKEIDPKKIGLVGHSEGGMIAPMVAANNQQVAFICLLAGPGIAGADIWNYQMRNSFIRPNLSATDYAIAAELVNGMNNQFKYSAVADSVKTSMKRVYQQWKQRYPSVIESNILVTTNVEPYLNLVNQYKQGLSWLQFFVNYEPSIHLSKLAIPILALNGAEDIQVTAVDNINGIQKAIKRRQHPQSKLQILPGLNHLFQTCKSPTQPYGDIEESFSPKALAIISEWINQISSKK